MDSTRDIVLNLYLDDSDMNNEEVNNYLRNIDKDQVLIKNQTTDFIKKLRAKQKIKKGKAYVDTIKEIISKINNGIKIPDMDNSLQNEIQVQFNKLKTITQDDIFELMEDKTKLSIMKYLKDKRDEEKE